MTNAELDALLARLTPEQLTELDGLLREGKSFKGWLPEASPQMTWDWPHLIHLTEHLQAVLDGRIRHLLVEAPVRHGKTELIGVRLPVFALEQWPTFRIIYGSYNATQARKISRKARRMARTRFAVSEERTAVEDWETLHGGGYRAVGTGDGVTGQGGNGIIVDDPLKNREEAESQVMRDKAYDWFTDDLYTRREPGAWTIVNMARWHEDDLIGRLLQSETKDEWSLVRLPALAEANDPLGRNPGEALCPSRYDVTALREIEKVIGQYAFAGLYQCRPIPKGGEMFPSDKVQVVDAAPPCSQLRWWDFAGTKDAGAYTTGVKLGFKDGLWWVFHVERFRLEAHERDQRVKLTAQLDGPSVPQWLEQEPGSGGKSQAQNFVRLLVGLNAHYAPVTGDKVTRAQGWAAQWQAGNVRLLRGDWNQPYIRNHSLFPSGKYLDEIDASASAFQQLVPTTQTPHVVSLLKESYFR